MRAAEREDWQTSAGTSTSDTRLAGPNLRRPNLQVTGAVGWRKDNLKYKKNEVFLDIVEQVNMLMSSQGAVLRCDVNGKVVMKVFLSGMPDVKLGLNDALEVGCLTDVGALQLLALVTGTRVPVLACR